MADGLLARHLRAARRAYRKRRTDVVTALTAELADQLELVPSSAGLHVSARLRRGGADRAEAVAAAARERSVAVDTIGQYCAGPREAGFAFGYGALRDGAAREGLTRFRLVLERL
jgi:GntR family transcriptional regulator/MocR family aminotransferase